MNENYILKVIQLNINSIISHKKRTEFEQFLKKHKPQVIILSETKLSKKHTLNINGYTTIRNDHLKNIECEQLSTPKTITTFECCQAKLKLQNNKNIIIASTYKPPTEIINKKQTLIKIKPNELNEIFKIDKNAYYLIGGDFNSKHTSWNNNTNCINGNKIHEWYETYKNTHNISIYTAQNPTCMRSVKGSYIDFGFISTELQIANTTNRKKLESELFSDHTAIFINIQIQPEIQQHKYIKNYKQAKWTQMKRYVHNETTKINIPTERNINKQEIDEYIKKISEIYKNAIEKYIPNMKIPKDSPKLSEQTLKLIKAKKKLLRKKHKNKASTIHHKIKKELKLINNMIFNSKKNRLF